MTDVELFDGLGMIDLQYSHAVVNNDRGILGTVAAVR
jgi:hypothetical protein